MNIDCQVMGHTESTKNENEKTQDYIILKREGPLVLLILSEYSKLNGIPLEIIHLIIISIPSVCYFLLFNY